MTEDIIFLRQEIVRLQFALEDRDSQIETLVRTALDAVIVIDQEGVIRLWNMTAEKIFGWTVEEALGRPVAELIIPPNHRVAHHHGMKLYLQTGEHAILDQRIEITALNKAGAVFPIELTVTSKKIGDRYSFTAFIRDISDRHEAQKALTRANEELERRVEERTRELDRSRSFLRAIVDAVLDPIFVKDRAHRWIEGNKAFWELLGGEDIARNKTDYDLFPKEQADLFWEGDERVFAGERFNAEEQLRTPDGVDLTIATKKIAFQMDDENNGIVGVIRDVTEQRKIEAELRRHRDNLNELVAEQTADLTVAKERAEAANIAKSEFLANMSHEIRTPMNAVIGLADILAISEPLTDKQRLFVKTLQSSAASLLTLLDDLLDISRIETRKIELESIPFRPSALALEAMGMLAVRAVEKGLLLELDDSGVTGKVYRGDPTRLRQIIVNLCGNAIKFTEKGHVKIIIAASPADEPGYDRLTISISDSGIGISKENCQMIFDKFVQADSSISRKYGGTGLGLAITKMLTELMGGSVTVESRLGEGSVFTVTLILPVAYAESMPVIHHGESNRIATVNRDLPIILLAEDQDTNLLVMTTLLERWGYRCDIVRDGAAAVSNAATHDYAAILMDVQMPGMDGVEATKRIRAAEKYAGHSAVPILGMTALAFSADRARGLAAGMNEYISKPFNPDALQKKLAGWIARV